MDLIVGVKNLIDTKGDSIQESSRRTIRYRVQMYRSKMGDSLPSEADLNAYRTKAVGTPGSIESVINTVVEVTRSCGVDIGFGTRLKRPRPIPEVPTIDHVGKLYDHVHVASWPTKLTAHPRAAWWRSFMAVSCWTAFRLGDIGRLTRCGFDGDFIYWQASKTERFDRTHVSVPIPPMIRRHVVGTPVIRNDTLFGLTSTHRQLRRELGTIARAAGVAYVCPQKFRRFGIQQWTEADSMAGKMIQGQSLGTIDHYVDVKRLLAKHAHNVMMPKSFFTDAELDPKRTQDEEMRRLFAQSHQANRELILRLAREIA